MQEALALTPPPPPPFPSPRALREDRTLIAAADYITSALGQRYVESVPLNMERAWAESRPKTPLICLLSAGKHSPARGKPGRARCLGSAQRVGACAGACPHRWLA